MNRLWLGSLASLGILLIPAAVPAQAQNYSRPGYYNPSGTPRLSPYLDITRGGNPGINYFLGTLPEIERRQTQAIQGNAIRGLQNQQAAIEEGENLYTPLIGTGHNTAFGNTAGYFPPGGRGGQQTAGAARPAGPARKK